MHGIWNEYWTPLCVLIFLSKLHWMIWLRIQSYVQVDRLMQERCNSSALAMELRLSCTNPSIWPCGLCKKEIISTHLGPRLFSDVPIGRWNKNEIKWFSHVSFTWEMGVFFSIKSNVCLAKYLNTLISNTYCEYFYEKSVYPILFHTASARTLLMVKMLFVLSQTIKHKASYWNDWIDAP